MSTVFCGCDPEANHQCGLHAGCSVSSDPNVYLEFQPPSVPERTYVPVARTFDTGATRDTDTNKFDYEGFLSPLVLERFAAYMHKNRYQVDGKIRDADNWQKGIPQVAYIKSGWRHFFDWWKLHRVSIGSDGALTSVGIELLEEAICGLLFNAMGYLHEHLKRKNEIIRSR